MKCVPGAVGQRELDPGSGDILETNLRLFVAIELPEQWRHHLAHLQKYLEGQSPGYARWVSADLLHLTLVFLGYQAREKVPLITSAVQTAAGTVPPFELAGGKLGYFGGAGSARVLWVGVWETGDLLPRLHREVTAQLAKARISFDAKPLAPHVTLGRARRDAQREGSLRIAGAISGGNPGVGPTPQPFHVEETVLMKSDLRPTGPVYTPLCRAALAHVHTPKG